MKRNSILALVLAFALLGAACGSDEAASETAEAETSSTTEAEAPDTTAVPDESSADTEPAMTEGFPVDVDHDAGTTTITAVPERIVSLSPTATEMLFAIGAGDQVIAADSFSNYPAEAPTTELSAFEPNLEAIAAENPDLVIISFDPGEIASGLEAIGVPTLVLGSALSLDSVYDQIGALGIATGHVDEAATVNTDIQAGIESVIASVEAPVEPVRLYHEIDDTFYSASSNSFIGALYAMLGVDNIADEGDTDGFGFPQLSPEYLLEADPQVIVFSNEVGYTAEDIAARPGWDAMAAVESGNLVQVDADIASRWGPRIVEFLEVIASELAKVPAAS